MKLEKLFQFRFASKRDHILIILALTSTFVSGISQPYSITLLSGGFQSMINYAKGEKNSQTDAMFLEELHEFVRKYSCVGGLLLLGGYLGTAVMNITATRQVKYNNHFFNGISISYAKVKYFYDNCYRPWLRTNTH